MTTPQSVFHAFLRPSVLQILRATGYYSTRPAVLDSLTDLAARYLTVLCESTAAYATSVHGDSADFDLTDVRMALEDAGALLPERDEAEQMWKEEEDVRGLEEFLKWFQGQRMKEMTESANGDGESEATDYLNALKKKHSKTADDAKYQGTLFGRTNDTNTGEVQVEGGPEGTINEWIYNRIGPLPQQNGTGDHDGDVVADDDNESRVSSALSSVGDRIDEDAVMDLS